MALEPSAHTGSTSRHAAEQPARRNGVPHGSGKPCGTPRGTGLGQLARRIAGWTSNGIVTVVIVLASVACGRQIVTWWAEEPSPPTGQPAQVAGWPDDFSAAHTVAFGDLPWIMERQLVLGPPEQVGASLQKACRQALQHAEPPGEEPGPLEKRLLDRLARCETPAETGPNWAIYRLAKPLVMVAGVHCGNRAVPPDGRSPQHCVASPAARVVVWAIGVPLKGNRWAAYVFRLAAAPVAGGNLLAEWKMPAGIHRLMAVGSAGGGFMLAIEGADPIAHWKKELDRSLVESGSKGLGAWQWTGAVWTRRYTRPDAGRLELYLAPRAEGGWVGLVAGWPGVASSSNTLRTCPKSFLSPSPHCGRGLGGEGDENLTEVLRPPLSSGRPNR